MTRTRWPKDAGGGRGLLEYGRFTDAYGATVRVQTSSDASRPHVWVFVQGGSTGATNKAGAHLTRQQARYLRAALDRWLAAAARSQ